MLVFTDDPLTGVAFLPDDVAENAAFLLIVIVPAAVHFFAHAPRNDGKRNQLGMRVLQGSAGRFTVILENQNVPEALVVFQVQHAVAVSPQHIFDRALRQRRQRCRMLRRFDDYFVRADSVHLVEEPFAFAVQFALDTQSRKFVWDHSNTPAWRIGAASVTSIHKNLGWRLGFIPYAEGAILCICGDHAFAQEFVRPFSAFRRNDHPSARDWVFSQLRQFYPPRTCSWQLRRDR